MSLSFDGFLEVSRTGAWCFAGDMVEDPEHAYDSSEPKWMPRRFLNRATVSWQRSWQVHDLGVQVVAAGESRRRKREHQL